MSTPRKDTHPASVAKYYATVSSDINCITDRPGYGTSSPLDATEMVARAFSVETAGNLAVTFPEGTSQTISVAANVIYPIQLKSVQSSGTTAAKLILYW